MEGMIVYSHYNRLGTIDKNTEAGIYGTIESAEKLFLQQEMVPVAERGEIQKGKAVIRCYVNGEVENYDILVTDIDDSGQEINKGLVIEITDQRLLDATGGIIQGMSGSPILQNGKLIGAVTHVFVQDSAKGYGIFIENMLSNLSA
jgi:stage IV sporulation protein B